MKRIEWHEENDWLNKALTQGGAFVLANDPTGRTNPMTIGWAQVGVVWSIPVMTVLIRESRYTFECINASESFSVCAPRPGELREELALCGTKSGRDLDKIEATGMTLVAGQSIETPIIHECSLHYECEIIARSQQTHDDFGSRASDQLTTYYPNGDHHLIVFGKIIEAYATRGESE